MMSSKFIKISIILLLALILRLGVLAYNLQRPNFNIQQDGYANYAHAISRGEVNAPNFITSEKKLFPGYPLLIYLFDFIINSPITSGIIIGLAASLGAIYLFWVITKSYILTSIFAFFPPIWIMQSAKVATEPLTVFLLLFGLFLYLRKQYFVAGIVLGLAFDVRTISVALLLALFCQLYRTKSYHSIILLLLGFAPFALLLFAYNSLIYHQIFYQFIIYSKAKTSIGIVQIVPDIIRAFNWGQYRILISGVLYLIANLGGCFILYRRRKESPIHFISFFWLLFSLTFIFSASPNPLLEDFARYSIPALPTLLFIFWKEKESKKVI